MYVYTNQGPVVDLCPNSLSPHRLALVGHCTTQRFFLYRCPEKDSEYKELPLRAPGTDHAAAILDFKPQNRKRKGSL